MLHAGGLNRRQTIRSLAGGGLLLPGLLSEMLGSTAKDPLSPKEPHYPAQGQAGHLPVHDGRRVARGHVRPEAVPAAEPRPVAQQEARLQGSGLGIPSIRPEAALRSATCSRTPARVIDDIAVVRSMTNINGDHFGATLGIHTGSATFNRPSIGSWG